MDVRYMAGAEPFFYPRGKTGCLCIHGFTGAPQEMRWLGQYLAERDVTVLGVRLAGHGLTLADMRRSHRRDWYASVLDGYTILRQTCDRVFVAGLSMGGVLGLYLASEHPVDGVICMAAPLYLEDPRLSLVPILAQVVPYIPKERKQGPDTLDAKVRQEQERRGEPVTGHVSYSGGPTRAIAQLMKLMKETDERLRHVEAPLLLIYSKTDPTVPPGNMEYIYNKVASEDKRVMWLEESEHVITEDVHRDEVFEATWKFISELSGMER